MTMDRIEFEDMGPKLKLSAVEQLESSFCKGLPDDYRQFLLTYNGGIPSHDGIEINDLPGSPTDVHVFFGIGRKEETENIDWNLDLVADSCAGIKLLPMACDSFGGLFCLNYTGDFAKVIYLDLKDGVVNTYDVSSTFNGFLDKLCQFPGEKM